MIWHDGRIRSPTSVWVGLDDRVFEHGLGLFETLRTWDGTAPLLSRHLDRLRASAHDLGLPTSGVVFPDGDGVASLVASEGIGPDVMLRITMTGGSASGTSPVCWMTARPLPDPEPRPIRVSVDMAPGGCEDVSIARHKNLNYWGRRLAYERARAMGLTEVLMTSPSGRLWEGSRNNVLFVPEGSTRTIVTPALRGPVIPGIMRAEVLAFATERGYRVEERTVHVDELYRADAVYLTNSVRGVRRVEQIGTSPLNLDTEVDLTLALADDLPRSIRSRSIEEARRG